jgi:hypothetical protein
MFCKITFVCMPHEGWMKNDSSFTKNGWNYMPNTNSLLDTSRWLLTLTLFLTPLGGFSPFSWWRLIFYFFSMTSLLRQYQLQWVCSFSPLRLHSTYLIQCWSLCDLHVAPAIFTQTFSFLYFGIFLRSLCEIIMTLPSIQLPSLITPSSLSSCNG